MPDQDLNVPVFHARSSPSATVGAEDLSGAAGRLGDDVLLRILDKARWAPSGDNTQPWRFEIAGPMHVVVHGFDTRATCVYDLDGRPSQVSIGALIETAAIAATEHGLRMQCSRRADAPETRPTFDLRFIADRGVERSPLLDAIERRSVQRRPLETRRLRPHERAELEAAVGVDHAVRWFEGTAAKARVASQLFRSAKLRLTMPEAYRVHRDVIEWNASRSVDRIPDRALGATAPTLRLMRFAMRSWERVRWLNRYCAGTWVPRIEMDLVPALACAAHFVIVARREPCTIDDHVDAGRAMQRLWLTATALGLMIQPEITPLVFARYARDRRSFSAEPAMADAAAGVGARLDGLLGADAAARAVFMGRIGAGAVPSARSTRHELKSLLVPAPS